MSSNSPKKPYSVNPDEKVTPVMVYTQNEMAWGEVITKQKIRVGAWLITDMAPAYVQLFLAQHLILSNDGPPRPLRFTQLFVPLEQVIGFHVMPSVKEPLYYDPNMPNRKMEMVTALSGLFQFKGHVFMSSQSNLDQFLDVSRESFIQLFDVEITHPKMPPPGKIRVPYAVIRRITSLVSSMAAS